MATMGMRSPAFERHTAFEDVTLEAGTLTAHVNGPVIGEREATVLEQELGGTIDEHRRQIRTLVIDLDDVETLCSLAIGLLLDLRGRCRWRTTAILRNVKPHLVPLLVSVGLDRRFRIEAVARKAA